MAKVVEVKDNIVTLKGEKDENYLQGEIIVFSKSTYGMLLSASDQAAYVALLEEGKEKVKPGMTGKQTGRDFRVSLKKDMLGKIFNYSANEFKIDEIISKKVSSKLEPIFTFPNEDNLESLDISPQGTTIDSREQVSETLKTGILTIDSMLALGKGQRQLIIGDRQTGKTTIATDTIINQKGKNVICIYVLIGGKNSNIINIYEELHAKGALDYTLIVASPASDNAIKNYLTPYAATTIAEAYKNEGQDVLIIYDDLLKHAKAYRSISLLIGSNPGREAYPGDIFYIHSRLLERSGNFNKMFGGGSITSLPIVETQQGFFSDYISTNLISITDGQLITSESLFKEGFRPAIDINVSVSRVGGKAQSKYLNAEASQLKSLYSQYSSIQKNFIEKEALSSEKQEIYVQGQILTELLKQGVGNLNDYIFEWIVLLLLNENAFYNFKVEDISYMKLHLLKFTIQNKMARNFMLFIQEHFKNTYKPIYDKTLIHYYAQQIFFPFLKWLGTSMYKDETKLVEHFRSQFSNFPNFYYDVKLDGVENSKEKINSILKNKVVRKTNQFTKDLNID